MVRPRSFRRNVFKTVLLVALAPAAVALVTATLLTLIFGFFATYRALGHKPAPLLRNR